MTLKLIEGHFDLNKEAPWVFPNQINHIQQCGQHPEPTHASKTTFKLIVSNTHHPVNEL